MDHCNPVATPFVKPSSSDSAFTRDSEEATDMTSTDATRYRRAAARIIYVALARPDLSVACRVASISMSSPKEGDDQMIKRIIRYLKGKPRVAIRYHFQSESEGITVFTDSDWAGDRATRKNTSGGVVCRGQHTISWWCKLQSNIALSSCEAELNPALGSSRRTECPTTRSVSRRRSAIRVAGGRVRGQRGDPPPGNRQGEAPPSEAAVAAGECCRGGANNSKDPASRKLRRCSHASVGRK